MLPNEPPITRFIEPQGAASEPAALADVVETSHESDESPIRSYMRNRWFVFGTLFLVTAALGLPLLWYSPSFSRAEKWYWSLIVTIYTIILLAIVVAIIMWAMQQLAAVMN